MQRAVLKPESCERAFSVWQCIPAQRWEKKSQSQPANPVCNGYSSHAQEFQRVPERRLRSFNACTWTLCSNLERIRPLWKGHSIPATIFGHVVCLSDILWKMTEFCITVVTWLRQCNMVSLWYSFINTHNYIKRPRDTPSALSISAVWLLKLLFEDFREPSDTWNIKWDAHCWHRTL